MTPVRSAHSGLFMRLLIVGCLLALPMIPPTSGQTTTAGETPTAGIYPEVRLRKLHLVRPDLIPYPIAYEVCC